MSEFRKIAHDYHHAGFTIRESVELAAEHVAPYRAVAHGRFDYPIVRHYVPSQFRYQNPSEWRSRNTH